MALRNASLKIFSFCLVGLFSACQSPAINDFAKVKPGMEKDLVLEAAGSPKVERRSQGKDLWIYEYKSRRQLATQKREVQFQDGKAVYVGAPVGPTITAAEQDRLNDESNLKDQENLKKLDADWAATNGAIQASPGPVLLDEQVRKPKANSPPDTTELYEKPKPIPHFETIQ